MLYQDDDGMIFADTLDKFTNWRRRWATAWENWKLADKRRRERRASSSMMQLSDLVRLAEDIQVDERRAREGRILFAVDYESAQKLSEQDPQFSGTDSYNAAVVDFFQITDPKTLTPTWRDRTSMAVRTRSSLTLFGGSSLGGIWGGATGFLASSGVTAAFESGLAGPLILGATVLGAAVGSLPKWIQGESERLLGAKFVASSNALYLAARAWIATVELRRLKDDGELELLANQLRHILWEAADFLNNHDRDTDIDFTRWDDLEPRLSELNDSLDLLLENAHEDASKDKPEPEDATELESHKHMLEQSNQQLGNWIKALDDEEEEAPQGKEKS